MNQLEPIKHNNFPEIEEYNHMSPEAKRDVEKLYEGEKELYLLEFGDWMMMVHVMSISLETTREQKRKNLGDMLDDLSEGCFNAFIAEICGILQKSYDNCKPFNNTKEQVDNILSWAKRVKKHKELLVNIIRERRKGYGLQV